MCTIAKKAFDFKHCLSHCHISTAPQVIQQPFCIPRGPENHKRCSRGSLACFTPFRNASSWHGTCPFFLTVQKKSLSVKISRTTNTSSLKKWFNSLIHLYSQSRFWSRGWCLRVKRHLRFQTDWLNYLKHLLPPNWNRVNSHDYNIIPSTITWK